MACNCGKNKTNSVNQSKMQSGERVEKDGKVYVRDRFGNLIRIK